MCQAPARSPNGEVPAHYYLKRTWVLENVLGTVGEHEERIAEILAADS